MGFNIAKLSTDAVPKHLTTLSISWLNNQFRAVSIHRGKVEKTWERPGNNEGVDTLDEFLRDAVRETGYQGQTVSLALTHPRLVQQMIDVPPVKGAALHKVIERQAAQQKLFSGEAAYASQPLVSTKTNRRVLLHLFPRPLLSQFMLACRRNDLHLVSVLPASAALQRQLPSLSPAKGDVVMLAAETAGSTTVVVCDGDGRLLVARTLQGSWNEDAGKLALDLNRTVLYVSQQFNVTLNRGLFLYGPGAAEQAAAVQRLVQVPVKVSPLPYDPFYWAVESLKVRPETAPNFQSPELQRAPQRRIFAGVVVAAAAVLVAGSIAVTAYSILQSRRELATIASFNGQISRIESRQKELDQVDAELQRKQQAIRLVLGERPPPKPAWLLAYLGQVVPADLVITNFSVRREADYYRVRLAGIPQQAMVTPNAPPVANSVETLKSALADGPFHMRILETGPAGTNNPSAAKPAGSSVPLSEWLNRFTSAVKGTSGSPAARQPEIDHFVIEGVVR